MALFNLRKPIKGFSEWDNNKPLLTDVSYKSAYSRILDLMVLDAYDTLYLDGEPLDIRKENKGKAKPKKTDIPSSSGRDPLVYKTIKDYLKREFMKHWESIVEDVDEIDIQDEYIFAKETFMFYMVTDIVKKEVHISASMPEDTKGFVIKLSPKIG